MKKSILSFLLFVSMFAGFKTVVAHEVSAPYIVRVTDMSEEMFDAFLGQKVQNMTIEFPENTCIPFKQILKGNLIHIVPEDRDLAYFKILRTFYVKVSEYGYEFSTDFQTWKSPLDFLTLEASFTIQTCDGQPTFCTETTLQMIE